jgi:hypothetical protein
LDTFFNAKGKKRKRPFDRLVPEGCTPRRRPAPSAERGFVQFHHVSSPGHPCKADKTGPIGNWDGQFLTVEDEKRAAGW